MSGSVFTITEGAPLFSLDGKTKNGKTKNCETKNCETKNYQFLK